MSYQDVLHYTTDRLSGFERLRVDVGQTGFFEGREFRTFKELNIAASAEYVIRAIVPINIILFAFETSLDAGWLRIGTYVGGTPGGTFSETLPILGKNNMTPGPEHRKNYSGNVYTPQVTLAAGGTHTGGTELDVTRIKTSDNSNFATSVGSVPDDERGVAANTYYFRLLNLSATDAVTGTMKVRWEERPVGFFAT